MKKVRTRTTKAVLIILALSGVSIGCSVVCPLFGNCPGELVVPDRECRRCLTEGRECGALGDPACCDGLRCKYNREIMGKRCVFDVTEPVRR
jgi:hypothetical protein